MIPRAQKSPKPRSIGHQIPRFKKRRVTGLQSRHSRHSRHSRFVTVEIFKRSGRGYKPWPALFVLADQGADTRLIQDYLGHRNIQHTVRYTATNPARFEKLWR